jgi:hypothetical protein
MVGTLGVKRIKYLKGYWKLLNLPRTGLIKKLKKLWKQKVEKLGETLTQNKGPLYKIFSHIISQV